MDLSITNLEAERQRRQIMQIERLARLGGELPKPEIYVGRIFTDVNFGTFKITLDWTELGRDPDTKKLVVRIPNYVMEEELFKRFPDPTVAKKLYDHIFKSIEEDFAKDGTELIRYGDTKFCG